MKECECGTKGQGFCFNCMVKYHDDLEQLNKEYHERIAQCKKAGLKLNYKQ